MSGQLFPARVKPKSAVSGSRQLAALSTSQ
jgi:hypothetical protein